MDANEERALSGLSFAEVSERLKDALGVKSDAALAEALGMKPTAFNNRKVAGSIPYEAIAALCLREKLSLDSVLGLEGGEKAVGETLSKDERELLKEFRSLDKDDRHAVKRHATALGMMRR